MILTLYRHVIARKHIERRDIEQQEVSRTYVLNALVVSLPSDPAQTDRLWKPY